MNRRRKLGTRSCPCCKLTKSLVTDGAGRCGWGIARQAEKASGVRLSDGALLSAFQFTCGGIKGLLSVWPDCGSEEVYFRQSQVRYRTGPKTMAFGLNVIEVSSCRLQT